MKVSFHGADQGVTGSCHLIDCAGKKVLIDCGMFQGGRELREENADDFGFDPANVDYLLLTHAHLDHCGRIPLLVKRGFSGEIIGTSASFELARLVLLDSAGLQEEEANYQNRRARRKHRENTTAAQPLYTTLDALNSFELFGRKAKYGGTVELAPGIRATFLDAGHILGSASILLELQEGERHHRILFSGDLGYSGRAILRDPAPPPHVDSVVMESTYGDRLHKQLKPSIDELFDVINTTIGRGGVVVIPSFALERAQEILYCLREGVEDGVIPASLNVFLDSPMAISATEIFARHPECFDNETLEVKGDGKDPFGLPGLHFTRETAESIALNQVRGGALIMAGSGMCTGGRIRHHLRQRLGQRKNSVVFVGYAAQGTLARRIIDGAQKVRIFSDEVAVRASVHTIGGFSAHADQAELLAWHRHIEDPATTYLVHGEAKSMQALAGKLANTTIRMPLMGDEFDL